LPEVICNTSPLQYLHQIGLLDIIHSLAGSIIVPPFVVAELYAGIEKGLDLPQPENIEWVRIQAPISTSAVTLITDLGPGESQVLMLVLEMPGSIALLDDALARRVANARGIPIKGTLGLLLDAKRVGLLETVEPSLDRLHELGFHLAEQTRIAVLKLAGES
jgi:predicted nucleic acid-binding protein